MILLVKDPTVVIAAPLVFSVLKLTSNKIEITDAEIHTWHKIIPSRPDEILIQASRLGKFMQNIRITDISKILIIQSNLRLYFNKVKNNKEQ